MVAGANREEYYWSNTTLSIRPAAAVPIVEVSDMHERHDRHDRHDRLKVEVPDDQLWSPHDRQSVIPVDAPAAGGRPS